MAEADNYEWMERMAGIAECPICTDRITNNRLLPCGHTFCLKCLEQYKRSSKVKGKSLPCPVCRKEFAIPKGGCSALPKNIIVEKLLEANTANKEEEEEEEEVPQCDTCESGRAAGVRCIQCEQNFCDDCEKLHKRLKTTSGHHVIPVSKTSQLRDMYSSQSQYCEHHPGNTLELICEDCDSPICWKCLSLMHTGHRVTEIGDAIEGHCEQLQSDIEEINDRLSMAKKVTLNIKDQEKQYRESVEKERGKVSKIAQEFIRTIVANENELLKTLNWNLTRNIKELEPHKQMAEKQIEELRKHKACLEQVKESGNVWEIFRRTKELHGKSYELLSKAIINFNTPVLSAMSDSDIHQQLMSKGQSTPASRSCSLARGRASSAFSLRNPDRFRVEETNESDQHRTRFDAKEWSKPEMKMGGGYAIGLSVTEQTQSTEHSNPYADEEHKSSSGTRHFDSSMLGCISLNSGSAVCGVAASKQKIFVAIETDPNIFVYRISDYHSLGQLHVPNMKQCSDMAFCQRSNWLYLADWEKRCIIRVRTEGAVQFASWNTNGEFGGISLTPESNLLLSCHDSSSLLEYDANGRPVNSVKLISDRDESIRPWHSLKLMSGDFVVGHGSRGNSTLHRVCLISSKGSVLKCFGDQGGSGVDRLFGPYHLAIDENHNLFVADCNNSRIVILDIELNYLGEISTELRKPRRMCLDAGNKRLFVTDNALRAKKASDGKVLVFSLDFDFSLFL